MGWIQGAHGRRLSNVPVLEFLYQSFDECLKLVGDSLFDMGVRKVTSISISEVDSGQVSYGV